MKYFDKIQYNDCTILKWRMDHKINIIKLIKNINYKQLSNIILLSK